MDHGLLSFKRVGDWAGFPAQSKVFVAWFRILQTDLKINHPCRNGTAVMCYKAADTSDCKTVLGMFATGTVADCAIKGFPCRRPWT
jgi:hypothetical protein